MYSILLTVCVYICMYVCIYVCVSCVGELCGRGWRDADGRGRQRFHTCGWHWSGKPSHQHFAVSMCMYVCMLALYHTAKTITMDI
jgi:hypothetical protein